MSEYLKIGSIVYAVHEKHVKERINKARVKVCRVKTYELRDDYKAHPVLTVVGNSKQEVDPLKHEIFHELEDAIKALQ